jgi:hypothetical protein
LAIETRDLDGFTLLLKGHPMNAGAGALSLVIDGTELQTKASDTVSLGKGPKGWKVARPTRQTALTKQAGAEGPIADALSTRQIYVYGTGGSPSPDELQRRKAVAQQAAEWSTPRLKLLLTFRVLADSDVNAADLQNANLILFGTKETNSVIAKYAAHLPLALNAGAADYGLMYVYPVDGRYVVIHSGLPWWTRFDQVNRYELSFLNTPAHALTTLGDYVLFRGGLDNIVSEGRFDRNWRLNPETAEKIRATGAVEVH